MKRSSRQLLLTRHSLKHEFLDLPHQRVDTKVASPLLGERAIQGGANRPCGQTVILEMKDALFSTRSDNTRQHLYNSYSDSVDIRLLINHEIAGFTSRQDIKRAVFKRYAHVGFDEGTERINRITATFEFLHDRMQQQRVKLLNEVKQKRLFALNVVVQRASLNSYRIGQLSKADRLKPPSNE